MMVREVANEATAEFRQHIGCEIVLAEHEPEQAPVNLIHAAGDAGGLPDCGSDSTSRRRDPFALFQSAR
jgi:hypothetical protein